MRKILLVDDEESLLKMLSWNLEIAGFSVLTALSAQEALSQINQHSIDLVLTDIRMPVMDGISLVKTIKKTNQKIPCLLMSGHADIDIQEEARIAGANGYINKPIKFDELINLVKGSI